MILLIDNFDSFTFNLLQLMGSINPHIVVKRHNEISIEEINAMQPSHLVISPGPGNPDQAGISLKVISNFAGRIPILGVCLGHQSIGQVFGASVVRATQPIHGKTSQILHKEEGIFKGVKPSFLAARYHSLVLDPKTLPISLKVTAQTEDGTIMGIEHKELSHVYGMQFHPESFLTECGQRLLKNFLSL